MRRWFASDEACLDYLDWLRWPDGFECPWCAGVADWSDLADRHRCGDCHRRVTPTAGTVFHGTRTPLTVWFEAAWLLTASKQGLSALELQHVTGLGSYQTAWAMLHKLRTVMSGEGRDRLSGRVEVDESFYGGFHPGHRGREPEGKTLVAAAVEQRGRGTGRIRMRLLTSASSRDLGDFIAATVEPDSTVVTDGWRAYPVAARRANVQHEPYVLPGRAQAHLFLPGVHRVFSLSKRVLEGTYQGGVQTGHLQAYLDEFVFRYNRRNARARGLLFLRLLEQAVAAPPAPYRDIVITHETGTRPQPSARSRNLPASLARRPLKHPWRSAA
jgi:transposase-like protein